MRKRKKYDERLVKTLQVLRTEKDVAETFCLFGVKEIEEKIEYLNKAMYSPEVFYSDGEKTENKHRYELTLAMFLEGRWRLYPIYQQIMVRFPEKYGTDD